MEELEEFEIVEDKKDEVVIYRDKDDLKRVFVTKPVLDKFKIEMPYYKLCLDNGDELYEIKPEEAIYIIENADNRFAPYDIRYQNFDFNNELEDETQETVRRQMEEPMDVIKIYRDVNRSERAFVTKDVMMRFHLDDDHHKVLLGDFIVYEIDPTEAINIINNSTNKYAPYQIEYVAIEFDNDKTVEKEDTVEEAKEEPIKEEPKVEEKQAEKKEEDEYRPRPRLRRENESDELYAAYLEGYYDRMFNVIPEKENLSKKEKQQPVILPKEEKHSDQKYDKEYLKLLKESILNKKVLDSVKAENVIKQRKQRADETDEEYNAYLSMFYGTPEQEDENVKTK